MEPIIIRYSRGRDRYDNMPQQLEANGFKAFTEVVLNDRSKAKGEAYICAPMRLGLHKDPDTNSGTQPWRSKDLVEPRFFLPLDLDGFADPDTFSHVVDWLASRYKGFAYTTASHTAEKPRCRIVLAQSRPTNREEGRHLGAAFQHIMELEFGEGAIVFDDSVYRGEQPLYTPLTNSQTFVFEGAVVDADETLKHRPKKSAHFTPKNNSEDYSSLTVDEWRHLTRELREGERNTSLTQLTGKLLRHGIDPYMTLNLMSAFNDARSKPPIKTSEVKRIVESISGNELKRRRVK